MSWKHAQRLFVRFFLNCPNSLNYVMREPLIDYSKSDVEIFHFRNWFLKLEICPNTYFQKPPLLNFELQGSLNKQRTIKFQHFFMKSLIKVEHLQRKPFSLKLQGLLNFHVKYVKRI